jgi:FkbH-like protein
MMNSDSSDVFSLHVSDRFGDSGLTGVLIAKRNDVTIDIDSFLMSCRVIGRDIEFAIWQGILDSYRVKGALEVTAEYAQTAKNSLVESFFDDLGLKKVAQSNNGKKYRARLDDINFKPYKHVGVTFEF